MWIEYARIAIPYAVVGGSLLGLLFSYTGKIQRRRTERFESRVSQLAVQRAMKRAEAEAGFESPVSTSRSGRRIAATR
jgi:hypothetical protein